jgi:predicted nucleic-acid-binding protein
MWRSRTKHLALLADLPEKGKADFADCLLGANNLIGGCEWTVTFDQPESKLEGFQLL